MRSTGTDRVVVVMKAGNAAGAKGSDQVVAFGVQLDSAILAPITAVMRLKSIAINLNGSRTEIVLAQVLLSRAIPLTEGCLTLLGSLA